MKSAKAPKLTKLKKENDYEFRKSISERRKAMGITQEELAANLGVSAQAVSKWENNLSCPDISLLPEIAKLFNISVDELLGVQQACEKKQMKQQKSNMKSLHLRERK